MTFEVDAKYVRRTVKEPLKNDCVCKYGVKNKLKILIDSV